MNSEGITYMSRYDLEDEVMELRATVQVFRAAHETNMETIERLNAELQTIATDRDAWKAGYDGLLPYANQVL